MAGSGNLGPFGQETHTVIEFRIQDLQTGNKPGLSGLALKLLSDSRVNIELDEIRAPSFFCNLPDLKKSQFFSTTKLTDRRSGKP